MLGLLNCIDSIVCDTYDRQFKRCKNSQSNHAMQVSFRLNPDYKEDGYRHLILRLFGTGYVTVLCNENWNVAPADKMHLENPPYNEGETGWKFLGCHDSCWRDAVRRLLKEYTTFPTHKDSVHKISNVDTIFNGWYQRIILTKEEIKAYRKLETETYSK